MLNRIRKYLSSNAAASANARRRGARGTPTSILPPQSRAQPAQAPPKPAFDTSKLIRNGFLVIGGGMVLSRIVLDTNSPNSALSQALYPKGRGKYMLTIERMDDKVANYETSYTATTGGIRAAMSVQSRRALSQQLGSKLSLLSTAQTHELVRASKTFVPELEKLNKLISKVRDDQIALLQSTVKSTFASIKPISDDAKDDRKAITIADMVHSEEGAALRSKLLELIAAKLDLEMTFMMAVEAVFMSENKTHKLLSDDPTILSRIKNSLLGLEHGRYDVIMERLSKISLLPSLEKPKIFVLTFRGDIMASQVTRLREEITALEAIANKERGDRVVIRLHSGGGTVTGYGLAANELLRIKDLGLPLDICVDEVAASGGYMMAAVADRIISSPFAVVGSVGVVSSMPNFSERLQREGVSFEEVTAGKYKRTLTPYKKANEEDRRKVKEDVEVILRQFKSFIKTNRPKLDVDKIATGETWQGEEALKIGLVDELATGEKYISQLRDQMNGEVLLLAVKRVQPGFGQAFEDDQHADAAMYGGGVTGMIQAWAAKVLIGALRLVMRENGNGMMGSYDMDDNSDVESWQRSQPRMQSSGVEDKYMLTRLGDGYEPRL